ncbi:MAG: His/Gly/Thr/Pro-type tRNA ligase C-terminal domain-containing protein [Patescibacteria group bacterium]|nr:His/Gly/Thr/Pro-type tRNA ligase C-terminal domain-containing protein [Patescibacteria group bacterium]
MKVDERNDERIGYKINKWELKGVPLRLEVGEQELKTKTVTLVRRF